MARDEQAIRQLAYELWIARGRPVGSADMDWYTAERRLTRQQRADSQAVDESVKESFPASDPPAPALPDKPPSNADEKWAAAEGAAAEGAAAEGAAAEAARSRSRRKKPAAKGEAESPQRSGRNGRPGRDVNP